MDLPAAETVSRYLAPSVIKEHHFKVYITISYAPLFGVVLPSRAGAASSPFSTSPTLSKILTSTIRRFSTSADTTLEQFTSLLTREILRRPEGCVAIAVSYKDSDGDVVEVTNEMEWEEALVHRSNAGKRSGGVVSTIPLLVHATVTHHQMSESCSDGVGGVAEGQYHALPPSSSSHSALPLPCPSTSLASPIGLCAWQHKRSQMRSPASLCSTAARAPMPVAIVGVSPAASPLSSDVAGGSKNNYGTLSYPPYPSGGENSFVPITDGLIHSDTTLRLSFQEDFDVINTPRTTNSTTSFAALRKQSALEVASVALSLPSEPVFGFSTSSSKCNAHSISDDDDYEAARAATRTAGDGNDANAACNREVPRMSEASSLFAEAIAAEEQKLCQLCPISNATLVVVSTASAPAAAVEGTHTNANASAYPDDWETVDPTNPSLNRRNADGTSEGSLSSSSSSSAVTMTSPTTVLPPTINFSEMGDEGGTAAAELVVSATTFTNTSNVVHTHSMVSSPLIVCEADYYCTDDVLPREIISSDILVEVTEGAIPDGDADPREEEEAYLLAEESAASASASSCADVESRNRCFTYLSASSSTHDDIADTRAMRNSARARRTRSDFADPQHFSNVLANTFSWLTMAHSRIMRSSCRVEASTEQNRRRFVQRHNHHHQQRSSCRLTSSRKQRYGSPYHDSTDTPCWRRGINNNDRNPFHDRLQHESFIMRLTPPQRDAHTRYMKRTGHSCDEDAAQLMAICPLATAAEALEALQTYNGQVYRAANYLMDLCADRCDAICAVTTAVRTIGEAVDADAGVNANDSPRATRTPTSTESFSSSTSSSSRSSAIGDDDAGNASASSASDECFGRDHDADGDGGGFIPNVHGREEECLHTVYASPTDDSANEPLPFEVCEVSADDADDFRARSSSCSDRSTPLDN